MTTAFQLRQFGTANVCCLRGVRPIQGAMVTIALIAGSMTLGVFLSRMTLMALFRVAEYARSLITRSL